MTFDLRNGNQVAFEDLFKDYDANKTEILKVIFAKQIEISKRAAAGSKAAEDEGCEGDADMYSLEHMESTTYSYNFSSQGLRVQPQWPHVIEACAERVTASYASLRKFARPGGLLERVSRAQ
jgi:hypothetical protein